MTDRAHRCQEAVVRTPTRELAQRLSGGVEVLLLWHPDDDSVELSVYDRATAAGFQFEVPPESAMAAFQHPYVYALTCDALRAEATGDVR